MSQKIYLDNNATTALDPRVLQAMLMDLETNLQAGTASLPLNPSSVHAFGRDARNHLTKARRSMATALGVRSSEILFTSGGTEALNMVMRGLFTPHFQGHIITSNVEHAAVYRTVEALQAYGCRATFLETGSWGAASVDAVREALQPDTRLIVLMAVNNETGVKTDIEAIAALAHERNIPFVVDGISLLGKEPFRVPEGVSAMCFSGHKFHAPKGVGFAVIRQHLKLAPLFTGGGQEYERRAGTENLAGILGLAEAVELLQEALPAATARMASLRDRLEQGLLSRLPDVSVNGEGPRVCNTTSLAFHGVEGESLLMNLDMCGIAVSHGSACSSGSLEPSRVLLNMGLARQQAASSLRFSLSRFTTQEEIDRCIEAVVSIVQQLRGLAFKQ
jgi:cysteine desulfurase